MSPPKFCYLGKFIFKDKRIDIFTFVGIKMDLPQKCFSAKM